MFLSGKRYIRHILNFVTPPFFTLYQPHNIASLKWNEYVIDLSWKLIRYNTRIFILFQPFFKPLLLLFWEEFVEKKQILFVQVAGLHAKFHENCLSGYWYKNYFLVLIKTHYFYKLSVIFFLFFFVKIHSCKLSGQG